MLTPAESGLNYCQNEIQLYSGVRQIGTVALSVAPARRLPCPCGSTAYSSVRSSVLPIQLYNVQLPSQHAPPPPAPPPRARVCGRKTQNQLFIGRLTSGDLALLGGGVGSRRTGPTAKGAVMRNPRRGKRVKSYRTRNTHRAHHGAHTIVQYTLTHAPAAPASSGHQSPLHRDAMKCPLCLTLQWWLEDGRAQSPLHLSTLHVAQSTVDALSSSELAAAVLLVRHHPPSTLSSAQPCVGNTLLA